MQVAQSTMPLKSVRPRWRLAVCERLGSLRCAKISKQTIALLPDSPAIDAGDPEVCGAPPAHGVDQRGYARPGQGYANCSIGAYEFGSLGPPTGCVGDCDADGHCRVNELVLAVNIALGVVDLGECSVLDGNDDGFVTVAELIAGVGNALCGCAGTDGGGGGSGAGDSICARR
jgi:hypothetical protein